MSLCLVFYFGNSTCFGRSLPSSGVNLLHGQPLALTNECVVVLCGVRLLVWCPLITLSVTKLSCQSKKLSKVTSSWLLIDKSLYFPISVSVTSPDIFLSTGALWLRWSQASQQVRSRANPCGFVMLRVALGWVCLRVLLFFACRFHFKNVRCLFHSSNTDAIDNVIRTSVSLFRAFLTL
jgi:hypothetical protein